MATTFNVAEKQYEIRDAMEGLHKLEDFFEMDTPLFLAVYKFGGQDDMQQRMGDAVRQIRWLLLRALRGNGTVSLPTDEPVDALRAIRAQKYQMDIERERGRSIQKKLTLPRPQRPKVEQIKPTPSECKRAEPRQPGEIPLYKVSQVRTQTSRYYGVCKLKKGNRPWYAIITREGKAWRGPCRQTEIEAAVDVQKRLGSDQNVRILEALARGEKVGPDMPGMAAEEGGADYIRRRHREIKSDATTVMIACACGEKYPKHDHPETCKHCGAKLP